MLEKILLRALAQAAIEQYFARDERGLWVHSFQVAETFKKASFEIFAYLKETNPYARHGA